MDLIQDDLSIDKSLPNVSSSGSTWSIIPEIMLHCFIRYLSGGSYIDIRLVAQISVPPFTVVSICV